MNQKLQKIFNESANIPADLESRIMVKVEKAARIVLFKKISIGSAASILFAIAIFIVSKDTLAEISKSGFGQYLYLAFSNSDAIISHWNDFEWTIIESAPITGITLCLGAIGLFMGAIRWTGRTWSGLGEVNRSIGKFAVL